MTGHLYIIGLGPGDPDLLTIEASKILPTLTDLIGYGPYLDRIPDRPSLRKHKSDNREELDRAEHALTLAGKGYKVGVVSSGDAGVFAMASAIFETIDHGKPIWKEIEITVLPGISAMFAAAARLGAPLGHDFCAISLSNNLKPWKLILHRLRLAAQADFVIALYNAVSKARPWQLDKAFELLKEILPPYIPVAFCQAISRKNEHIHLTTLGDAKGSMGNMQTLVLIGNRYSQLIPQSRENIRPWFYTSRSIITEFIPEDDSSTIDKPYP
ncbi:MULTISPECIES: precorrin-3B C(17)-methyltransferase [Commensalibacter]|uniref:precorrin-3B C(17)-methyltransferase n=1 Tax=Commensalibacter TaxID=1079922 RepID=UPI0012D8FDA8|nr:MULTISPECIES: precorrin-3B C(17)-methyltransferase [Commensalibacter]MBH9969062.1 precorrin-3B C(17)-methyltransferase [Commensalibacter sp. M0265]MBH9976418.1 precorrin-3B C(17)-methyltransferase [Commensalibacter sp. M0266]MBH9992646.1 precorrin-3B C(17)-methyltransferase [Commensalibacter sp. M0270]MBI0045594.1 precorrin-3B C(17)-methyltransferase [Commensalibacter sp. M0267]MBI0055263.1 precorrin-3B C(17)-methyltransferase [Commensalibacter sp. M0268]